MKYLYLILLTLFTSVMFSQAPALMTYQMVVRDNAGAIVASANVGVRLSILQGSAAGTEVFAETHFALTNTNGLLSVLIGNGTNVSGSITAINWAEGPFFLRAQADPTGGSNYSIENISQLVSVPYALHSSEAENAIRADSSSFATNASHANIADSLVGYIPFSGNYSDLLNQPISITGVSTDGDSLYLSNGAIFVNPGVSSVLTPQLTTLPVSEISFYGCRFNANVDGVVSSSIMERGFVWSDAPNPNLNSNVVIVGEGTGSFDTAVYGYFNPNVVYTVRAFVRTENNIAYYGNSTTFQILPSAAHTCGASNVHNPNLTYGTMTDQEGNVYKTIVIGTQEWMAENLNTSIYRNGDAIPTNLSNAEWENTFNTQQGAWAYYNNDESYACPYGKLYNWYALNDARNLCPVGWHVPSDEEWSTLTNFLGGDNQAGLAMKAASTEYWNSQNLAENSSGFSGLPGGYRNDFGGYTSVGFYGYWWSSTQSGSLYAWYRSLDYFDAYVLRSSFNTQYGFSVRCLRD
jgi:uncharacterized protein (TIGR02145 family)